MDWVDYWAARQDGGHRSQDPEFLRKEASEKLYHLGPARSLLDFGCGASDLLQFIAPSFETVVGVDFSPSMLDTARTRLSRLDLSHVQLVEADDVTVWERVTGDFDRISSAAVVQYFDPGQLAAFIAHSRRRLTPKGMIVLFDVIDPRLMYLYERGVLSQSQPRVSIGASLVRGSMKNLLRRQLRRLARLPVVEMGIAHHPAEITEMAAAEGMVVEIVSSMYYEYRFHALLRPLPEVQPAAPTLGGWTTSRRWTSSMRSRPTSRSIVGPSAQLRFGP